MVLPEIDEPELKRQAYAADITYGTNNEFGFDYLRDNMAGSLEEQVTRGHYFAIVDEVDSILIDEARTPLIISGRADDAQAAVLPVRPRREGAASATVTTRSTRRSARSCRPRRASTGSSRRWRRQPLRARQPELRAPADQAALQGKELFKRDVDYVVQDGEVKIVDEFTGRILEGRRWTEGLHQAVEAKEGVRIKEENQTLATVTLQNYFKLYDKLAGHDRYRHRPRPVSSRTPTASRWCRSPRTATWSASTSRTSSTRPRTRSSTAARRRHPGALRQRAAGARRHDLGREVREAAPDLLDKRGIPHYGAEREEARAEAVIVTQAGRIGAVTVATNMAGRGVDILLGGNPEGLALDEILAERRRTRATTPEKYEKLLGRVQGSSAPRRATKVRELGGLYVLGTERHESRRIDNQLRGRSGRQGDPGESRFYLSLEDELMRLFATGAMNWVMGKAFPDDVPARGEDGHHGDRARAAHGRGPQLRDPQGRPQVRRGDERAAQGHLQAPPADHRRWRPARGVARGDRGRDRPRRERRRVASDFSEDWDVDELLRPVAGHLPGARDARPARASSPSSESVFELLTATRSSSTRRRKPRSARTRCARSSAA